MSEEETSQSTAGTTNPEGVTPSSGETVTETPAGESPPAAEESRSLEQYRQDWENANKKLTEMGQENAGFRQREGQYQQDIAQRNQALQALGGAVQAQQDPLEAARQAWQKADEDYSPDRFAHRAQYENLYRQQVVHDATLAAQQAALQASQTLNGLPSAMDYLQTKDQNEATRIIQQSAQTPLTVEEWAVVTAKRQGRLTEAVDSQRQAAEQRAKSAQFLNSFGEQGGRGVPGSHQGTPKKYIAFEDWATLNDVAKQRFRESGEEIEIRGAPKHFDPSKD